MPSWEVSPTSTAALRFSHTPTRMRISSGILAIALALGEVSSAQNSTNATEIALEDELANLEHYWSYGRSPPVYPSRESPLKDSAT